MFDTFTNLLVEAITDLIVVLLLIMLIALACGLPSLAAVACAVMMAVGAGWLSIREKQTVILRILAWGAIV